jgi:hypothetical protein
MHSNGTRGSQLAHRNDSRKLYWLKMCPKCHGDLYLDEDWFGRSLTCLQCGRSSLGGNDEGMNEGCAFVYEATNVGSGVRRKP